MLPAFEGSTFFELDAPDAGGFGRGVPILMFKFLTLPTRFHHVEGSPGPTKGVCGGCCSAGSAVGRLWASVSCALGLGASNITGSTSVLPDTSTKGLLWVTYPWFGSVLSACVSKFSFLALVS
jgi:hypothetical protein